MDKTQERMTAEERDQYIADTALTASQVIVQEEYSDGSVKITDELHKSAVEALVSRIENTREYTETRIARINKNYQIVEQKVKGTGESKASVPLVYPETYVAKEQWVDDQTLIFSTAPDNIELDDPGSTVEEFIIQSLELNPLEELTNKSAIEYFARYMEKEYGPDNPYIWQMDQPDQSQMQSYYIKRADIIKEFLKGCLDKSDFLSVQEQYHSMGVTSGHYINKKWPRTSKNYKLTLEGKKKGKRFKQVIEEKKAMKFIPKDPRKLIFRKDGLKHGVIEIIDTNVTVSMLLSETFDENGKPLKNAPYDPKRLKDVIKIMKEKKTSGKNAAEVNELTSNDDDYDNEELFRFDGDVVVYEYHWVTMVLDKKAVKCLNSYVKIDEEFYCIGLRKYPFAELAYDDTYFIEKDGDCAGKGLPEIMEELQLVIDDLTSFCYEYVKRALYAIPFGNANIFEDPNQLSNLKPGEWVQVKNTNGISIKDALYFHMPPLEVITYTVQLINILLDILRRISRKGPSGERLMPDPNTATEATQIFKELEKSVNRVAIRVNKQLEEFLKSCYVFYLLNLKEDIKLKVPAIRFLKGGTKSESAQQAFFKQVDRVIEISPEKLFIEDLGFKITAIETIEKQAVEKQQFMQFMNLLNTVGVYDPKTGQARPFTDEMGQQVEINWYTIINRGAQMNDISVQEIWKKLPKPAAALQPFPETQTAPSVSPSVGAGPVPPDPGIPPISAIQAPTTGDMLGGVMNA